MRRVQTMLLGVAAVMACAAFAVDQSVQSLLPADAAAAFTLNDGAGGFARVSTTPVTGQSFKSGLRVEVTSKPQRAQEVTLSTRVDAAVASGDVLMISFWMRSAAPGDATLDAAFRAPMPAGGRGARGGVPGAPTAAGPPPAGAPPQSGTSRRCRSAYR